MCRRNKRKCKIIFRGIPSMIISLKSSKFLSLFISLFPVAMVSIANSCEEQFGQPFAESFLPSMSTRLPRRERKEERKGETIGGIMAGVERGHTVVHHASSSFPSRGSRQFCCKSRHPPWPGLANLFTYCGSWWFHS